MPYSRELARSTKQELGERVADVTQLTSQLAHTENARHNLEERLHTLTEESQRREELLQNDLAGKSKELSDTLRKLTTVTQEKQRQAEEEKRQADLEAKAAAEAAKKMADQRAAQEAAQKPDEEMKDAPEGEEQS